MKTSPNMCGQGSLKGLWTISTSLRRSGTPIVLVTSSPGLVIQPLAIYLGCSDTLTTPVLYERGRLVGMGSGPPCYGDGKRHWAEQWAASHGIDMQDAAAYADNWSDRSLLERVGRAVVVHPRGRLLRLARGADGTSFDRADLPGRGCCRRDPSVGAGASLSDSATVLTTREPCGLPTHACLISIWRKRLRHNLTQLAASIRTFPAASL